jgi:predicted nucleic acid-binding Zn ribbon protein
MKRTDAVHIGDVLGEFFKDNPQLRQKILEVRIKRAWGEMLGPMIVKSTRSLYVKNRVLHVSVTSSALRNELMINRKRLLKSLNEYVKSEAIVDIVIR